MDPQILKTERRRHPRTISRTTAIVRTKHSRDEYEVSNLSVCGALLVGPQLPERSSIGVELQLPLYPRIHVRGRVIRCVVRSDGRCAIGIEFHHSTDATEDHIQSALLSELERLRAIALGDRAELRPIAII